MAKRDVKKGSMSKEIDPIDEPTFGKGQHRWFVKAEPNDVWAHRKITSNEYIYLAVLVLSSVYIRLSNLSEPDSVVFDEVHFGKFAKNYILGKFFMDVHPPLAKMLFAGVGMLGGFKGDFDFEKIGDKYPETVPYAMMRLFPAAAGIGTLIFCYLTLRSSGCRPLVCLITSSLLLVENSNVTISRYILLDSPLMFFIAATIYSFKKFEIQNPYTFNWYRALIACGIALGLSLSSKWVGLFTLVWVGIGCVYHMWVLIGDLTLPSSKVVHHAVSRATLLLGIPLALYLFFFQIHFQLLNKEGDGSAFMSSAFRAGLEGNTVPTDIEANVGLGSIVTIKHLETRGGYLHSHNSFYPAGSKQQQVTLYPHLDSNNEWLIEPYNSTMPEHFVPLHDGIKVRLKHVNTGRRLHSHDEKPPVSERDWQKETSCYGYDGFAGDANDDFIFEIVQKRTKDLASKWNVKAVTTIFRLRHAMTGNYLFAGSAKLPDWGFEQTEVTTASLGTRPLTYWYIETNNNERINDTVHEIVNYPKLSFLDKFIESHQVMWKINSGLTGFHPWQSDPTEWPLLLRGISYWSQDQKNVYFLGNAPTWWASTFAVLATIIYTIVQVVRWQLGATIGGEKHLWNFNYQILSYTLGWILHYVPFYIMGRQLFLHHYIPALYFSILTLGHYLDIGVSYWAKVKALKMIIYGFIFVLTAFSMVFYMNFSPLIYARPWTKSQCISTKLVNGWDYDCNNYLNDLSDYNGRVSSKSANSPAAPEGIEAGGPKETPYVKVDRKELLKGNPEAKKDESSDKPVESMIEQKEQLVPPLPDEPSQ